MCSSQCKPLNSRCAVCDRTPETGQELDRILITTCISRYNISRIDNYRSSYGLYGCGCSCWVYLAMDSSTIVYRPLDVRAPLSSDASCVSWRAALALICHLSPQSSLLTADSRSVGVAPRNPAPRPRGHVDLVRGLTGHSRHMQSLFSL